jgi:Polyketide cyclase / dehydrase and lipid transport
MGTARAAQSFRGSVHQVESRWYDTSRWRAWVDGLDRVVSVENDWPRVGAIVTWESGPDGRGTVTEQVTAYEPLGGLTLEVQDSVIRGRQSVAFRTVGDRVEVVLSLVYAYRNGSLITPLIDRLFVKREMARSLARSLARFETELASRRVGPASSAGDEGD